MADPRVPTFPFPAPTAAEAQALAVAAAYLHRAGTQTAGILLGQWSPPEVAALFESLRDQMLAGAALCDGLLDLAPDRGRHRSGGRMDPTDPSPALVAGGLIVVIVAFAARELASGALRAAGTDLRAWAKRRAGA